MLNLFLRATIDYWIGIICICECFYAILLPGIGRQCTLIIIFCPTAVVEGWNHNFGYSMWSVWFKSFNLYLFLFRRSCSPFFSLPRLTVSLSLSLSLSYHFFINSLVELGKKEEKAKELEMEVLEAYFRKIYFLSDV